MRIRSYYGGILPQGQNRYKWLLFVYYMICTSCMKCIFWTHTMQYLTRAHGLIALALLMFGRKAKAAVRQNYSWFVWLVALLPFLSIYNSYTLYGQDPAISFMNTSGNLIFLLYFVLHRYRVSEAAIMRFFLLYAVIIAMIQIVQQFTYPNAYFGVASAQDMFEKGTNELAEIRNGLWRFRIGDNGYFTVPIIFSAWIWLKKRYDRRLAMIFLLLCVSIYLTLTRQVMVACLFALFMAFFVDRRLRFRDIAICITLMITLYFAYDILWGALAEKTADEANEDNIRVLAATYFWEQSTQSPLTLLLGYGEQYQGSRFGQLYNYQTQVLHFYVSDVGFVGQIYTYGLPYVIICYIMIARMFFHHRKQIPVYIRLFVIFGTVMSPMIFPFQGIVKGVWAMLLYICDLHIAGSPLALETTKLTKVK